MIKNYLIIFGKILIVVFALIGLATTSVYIGMHWGVFNVRGSSVERDSFFKSAQKTSVKTTPCNDTSTVCDWDQTPEWNVVQAGLIKDKDIITRVSHETGVPARLIISTVTPEQLRFFTSNRESFKKYFEPLKILGSLSKFSLGVSGIKQDTATAIENHLKDTHSAFYPGADMANLIAYNPTDIHDTVLYDRLTDAHNHYYSYLYTALFLKEVQAQWNNASLGDALTPGISITIFNTGFGNSNPNTNPIIGGSTITLGGKNYAFGELGTLIYNSDVLTDYFPKQ
ncbi:MAG: hypothetical protein WCQ32_03595 [bacterium]